MSTAGPGALNGPLQAHSAPNAPFSTGGSGGGGGHQPARPFGDRLGDAVARYGPLCVGVDPHPSLLASWGLEDSPDGLAQFVDACLAAFAGRVSTVKPQSAFFERHGAAGIAVLERLLAGLAGTGTLSVLDVKRGDIGSTMDGYADAYLRVGAPLGADAVTLTPYLGFGSLRPGLDAAAAAGRGVFVLARTSNPEGADVQLARPPGAAAPGVAQTVAQTVAQSMVDAAAAENAGPGAGSVGVVVGATADHGLDLSALNGPVLVPGLGAQGAGPDDVVARFAGTSGPVLPAAARSVLATGPGPEALRGAASALNDQLTGPTAGRTP